MGQFNDVGTRLQADPVPLVEVGLGATGTLLGGRGQLLQRGLVGDMEQRLDAGDHVLAEHVLKPGDRCGRQCGGLEAAVAQTHRLVLRELDLDELARIVLAQNGSGGLDRGHIGAGRLGCG